MNETDQPLGHVSFTGSNLPLKDADLNGRYPPNAIDRLTRIESLSGCRLSGHQSFRFHRTARKRHISPSWALADSIVDRGKREFIEEVINELAHAHRFESTRPVKKMHVERFRRPSGKDRQQVRLLRQERRNERHLSRIGVIGPFHDRRNRATG